jgi:hypothetical protein
MIATYVPAKKTPLTFEQAATAMRDALTAKLGSEPSREVLALALAKTALETGRWQSMYCFGWGNVKASPSYQGSYYCIELNEVLDGKVVWFAPQGRVSHKGGPVIAEASVVPPGHPQTRMRAYASAEEGAKAYVDFVAGGRYSVAWKLLLTGDAAGFATALRAAGYYTAPLAEYLKGVVSLQSEFIAKLGAEPHDTEPQMPAVWPTLRKGSKGSAVERLQKLLTDFGMGLKVDGDFGSATDAAVRVFQRSAGLKDDGIVGMLTWRELESGKGAEA